jgi:hypothetical protein
MRGLWVVLGSAATMLACGVPLEPTAEPAAESSSALSVQDAPPDGKGGGLANRPPEPATSSRPKSTGNGIYYHGGPVLHGTTHVYFIWYGTWPSSSTTPTILDAFASSVGGTPYYAINTTYTDGLGAVANQVSYAGATSDNSRGTSLTDADIQGIVSDAITSGRLPADTNGVYFVLTSSDVAETSGFCTSYCGWHTHGTIAGIDVKYSFVGDPARCPSGCAEQWSSSPNGNPSADGMANIIAHELEEAATDPDLNAWYDRRGYENADKCVWTFGTMYTTSNGSFANMNFGGRDWLIQRNWVNASGGYCALAYP